MNPPDESLLSAYLDGEIDAEGRQAIESAAAANPRVAGRLADLARVRDLIATLPRSGPTIDLSALLVDRIGRERRERVGQARRLLLASCGLAAAAAIVVVATILAPRPRPDAPWPNNDLVALPIRPRPIPAPVPRPFLVARLKPTPALLPGASVVDPIRLAQEEQARDDALAVGEILAGPDAREIIVEVESLGPRTPEWVEEAIRSTNRRMPKHARVWPSRRYSAGPDRPLVYVLLMDDVERARFGQKLESYLPKASHTEVPAAASLIAVLPGMGRIDVRGGLPRGTLLPAPSHLNSQDAFRDVPDPGKVEDVGGEVAEPRAPAEVPRAIPRPLAAGRFVGPPHPSGGDRPPSAYIVWITTRGGPRP